MEKKNSAASLLTMLVLLGQSCGAKVLNSSGTAGKNLDAQTLVNFGREFNYSLITMIGRVIENYHACTAWSEWTECGTILADFFSTRTRTRHCVGKEETNIHRNEIETGVCEGRAKNPCPLSYDMTTNGFCLKLYKDTKSNSEAEAVCKSDGGYLVNIDSDQKYDNVKSILMANNITSQIHIDGSRANSQWKFSYGIANGYFHWLPSFPSATSLYDCLRLTGNRPEAKRRFRTYNFLCDSGPISFICEIVFKTDSSYTK
ncbi:uncharacterized protein LOC132742248 [Ruditapes philippinarum]|uniref:uncharacterized protein LOC132742248 n=1 Tax=Ruditapes philippinarum TaxID=129788 RepID=UPI00295C2105|nr:uncharacterized protein LOC132742248 [Ruditapes philippinarum]